MNKEQYKAHLRQRLYEGIVDHVVDKVQGYYNRARSIFGPPPGELIARALTDPRYSGTDTITKDTSALRYAARDIPGFAAVEKAVAEAGYFSKGGVYDLNNDGKEDHVARREQQAKLEKMPAKERRAALRPEVPPFPWRAKQVGHPGEIPNSDPLPSDTQRA